MAGAAPTLLLIDDDASVRETMTVYIRAAGFTLYEAHDGEEGLATYKQQQPDIVLCDLETPKLHGFEVLKAIKADTPETPIIVLTSVGVMSDVVEALRLGASDYLVKPIVDMEVLQHSIARCLEQVKLRRENNDYRQQLEAANTDLQASLKLLEQDQLAGRQVQLKMLPPTPKQLGAYQFSHKIVPSLYLSGDFVDYFMVGKDHAVFFIADVSGHGASSAFVTVLLKNLFARKRSDYLHLDDNSILSPVNILQRANKNLLNTGIGKHATLCVGVINLQENSLCYSVAGHLPQPILAAGGDSQYLQAEGMPVGLFESAQYSENTLLLPENFVLSLFSDGILEVLPAEGVLQQEQYLLDILAAEQDSIEAVVNALGLEKVVDAPDDIAVLLISRLPI